jgi:hypothetical protein
VISEQFWAYPVSVGTTDPVLSSAFSTSVDITTGTGGSDSLLISTRNLYITSTHLPRFYAKVRFGGALTSRVDFFGITNVSFTRDTSSSNNIKLTSTSTIDTGFAPSLNTWYYVAFAVTGGSTIDWAIGTDPFMITNLAQDTGAAITYNTGASEVFLAVTNLTTAARSLFVDFVDVRTGLIP